MAKKHHAKGCLKVGRNFDRPSFYLKFKSSQKAIGSMVEEDDKTRVRMCDTLNAGQVVRSDLRPVSF